MYIFYSIHAVQVFTSSHHLLHTMSRKGSNFQGCCSYLQKPINSIASEAMCTLSMLYPCSMINNVGSDYHATVRENGVHGESV